MLSGPLTGQWQPGAQVLASAGVASRRACIDLIKQGVVKVNQQVVTDPATKVDGAKDRIQVGYVTWASSGSMNRSTINTAIPWIGSTVSTSSSRNSSIRVLQGSEAHVLTTAATATAEVYSGLGIAAIAAYHKAMRRYSSVSMVPGTLMFAKSCDSKSTSGLCNNLPLITLDGSSEQMASKRGTAAAAGAAAATTTSPGTRNSSSI